MALLPRATLVHLTSVYMCPRQVLSSLFLFLSISLGTMALALLAVSGITAYPISFVLNLTRQGTGPTAAATPSFRESTSGAKYANTSYSLLHRITRMRWCRCSNPWQSPCSSPVRWFRGLWSNSTRIHVHASYRRVTSLWYMVSRRKGAFHRGLWVLGWGWGSGSGCVEHSREGFGVYICPGIELAVAKPFSIQIGHC